MNIDELAYRELISNLQAIQYGNLTYDELLELHKVADDVNSKCNIECIKRTQKEYINGVFAKEEDLKNE